MHEISLVRSLVRQVDQIATDHDANADAVQDITIEIGPLSGVEPELVRMAYDQLCYQERRPPATLTIELSSLQVRCLDCESDTELQDFMFRCGQCHSGRVRVISGDEFRLLSITFEEGATLA